MHVCMYACVQMIHGFLPILLLAGVVTLSCKGFALPFIHVVPQGSSIIDYASHSYLVMTLCIFSKIFSLEIPSLFQV